jgi:hypothetical protein
LLQSEAVKPRRDVYARLPDAILAAFETLAQTGAMRECLARPVAGKRHAVHDTAEAMVVVDRR